MRKSGQTGGTVEPDAGGAAPIVDPKKSIQKNKVVCLECGQEFKMLSPKHLKSHGLDAKEYRKKYGFSTRQPLCAKTLSEKSEWRIDQTGPIRQFERPEQIPDLGLRVVEHA